MEIEKMDFDYVGREVVDDDGNKKLLIIQLEDAMDRNYNYSDVFYEENDRTLGRIVAVITQKEINRLRRTNEPR